MNLGQTFKNYIPQVSIDCVLFRFVEDRLEIAVLSPAFAPIKMLLGGFVFQEEALDEAAVRVIREHTGIPEAMICQFGTYGDVNREFDVPYVSTQSIIPKDFQNWISQRFITTGYYSAINDEHASLVDHPILGKGEWLPIEEAVNLSMDHPFLVEESLKALTRDLHSKPVLLGLLPTFFTITNVQKLYEAILRRPIDRGNFRQRILKSRILVPTGQTVKSKQGRPAKLYKLEEKTYLDSLSDHVKFGF